MRQTPRWQVLEERNSAGVAKTQYVWSPVYVDALVERDRDADGNSANGREERLYAVQDANWNTTALVSATSGQVVERYTYDPFGAVTVYDGGYGVRANGSAYGWTVLFQGLKQSAATGLYHARNRDYSATLGRWVTTDPIGFAGGDVNLYRMEGNSPVNRLDPSGLSDDKKDVIPDDLKNSNPEQRSTELNELEQKLKKDSKLPRNHPEKLTVKEIKQIQQRKAEIQSANKYLGRNPRDGHPGKGQNKGRQGSARCGALAAIGVTSLVAGGVEYIYGEYVDAGEVAAERGANFLGLGNGLRWAMLDGELPTDKPFTFTFRGERYKGWLEKVPGGGDTRYLHVIKLGPKGIEPVIKPGDIPVQGI